MRQLHRQNRSAPLWHSQDSSAREETAFLPCWELAPALPAARSTPELEARPVMKETRPQTRGPVARAGGCVWCSVQCVAALTLLVADAPSQRGPSSQDGAACEDQGEGKLESWAPGHGACGAPGQMQGWSVMVSLLQSPGKIPVRTWDGVRGLGVTVIPKLSPTLLGAQGPGRCLWWAVSALASWQPICQVV